MISYINDTVWARGVSKGERNPYRLTRYTFALLQSLPMASFPFQRIPCPPDQKGY